MSLLVLSLMAALSLPHWALGAEITWINPSGGAWSVAANWSPAKVPAAGDTALIINPGAYSVTNTVAFTVANLVVGGGTGTQTLVCAAGATLTGGGVVGTQGVLRVQGAGQLLGAGDIVVHGRWEWAGGILNRSGGILIDVDGAWVVAGTTFSWTSGSVVNQGRATWGSGSINCTAPGTLLRNEAGGTLLITNSLTCLSSGVLNGRRFQNQGLLRMEAPAAAVAVFQVPFDNGATVEVASGRFTLRGGSSSGSHWVAPGAVLEFESATNSILTGASFIGEGAVEVSGGFLDVAPGDPLVIPSLLVSGGVVSGGGGVSVPGQLTWTGGTVTNLTLVSEGELLLLGTTHTLNSAILENRGHGVMGVGSLQTTAGTSSLLTNSAGATLEITNVAGWALVGAGSHAMLANRGLIRRTLAASSVSFSSDVENRGDIELERGTLSLPAPARFTQYAGVTHLAGGGMIVGNPLDLEGGVLSGTGTINGSVTNSATLRPGEEGAGTLSILNDYTQTSAGRLEIDLGGSVIGGGYDHLAVSDQAALSGTIAVTLVGGFLPDPTNRFAFLTCRVRTNTFDTFLLGFTDPPGSLVYSNTLAALAFTSTGWELLPVADQQLAESNKLSLTIRLSEVLPLSQKVTFTLVSAPANMALNATNGLLTWTPTEAQGPGIYPVVVRAVDNAAPPREQTVTFQVNVSEVNLPPGLAVIRDATIDEEMPFTLQLQGTDADLPPNLLTFSLLSGPPGMHVSAGGLVSWIPEEDQGPGVYKVTVGLTDDGVPPRSTNRTFTLTVREVNQPPTILDPGDQVAVEGELLELQLLATDPDYPANDLAFALVSGPAGTGVRRDGLLTWRPAAFQTPSTNRVTVRVTDNGSPSGTTTLSFNIVVVSAGTPALSISLDTGGAVVEWPTVPSGYRLQSAAWVDPFPLWVDVPGAPSNLGDRYQITLPAAPDPFFLRLWKDGSGGIGTPGVATLLRGPYLQMRSSRSIVVRFKTNRAVTGRVRFGTVAGQLASLVDGAVTNSHEIRISGLAPDTRYFYSVGSDQSVLLDGPTCFFQTAPEEPKPTRIWVIGDSGTANANAAAVRNAYLNYTGTRYTDVWLMLGDNAYTYGLDSEYQAAVFNMYPTLLRQTALWPTLGNHETDQNHTPVATTPYLSIFTLPTAGEAGGVPSGTERYYSFDHGAIHFVCLDSMTSDRSSTGVMASWLRADLEAATNAWLVAFWHHPPYSKGSHDSDDAVADPELVQMRENIVPILESHGVDLVLSGHSHSYERSYLLHQHYGYSPTLTPEMILDSRSGGGADGPYVKRLGASGGEEGTVYAVAGSSGQVTLGPLDHPAMRVSLAELGSMVIDVDGPTLEARFLGSTGLEEDHFVIRKP